METMVYKRSTVTKASNMWFLRTHRQSRYSLCLSCSLNEEREIVVHTWRGLYEQVNEIAYSTLSVYIYFGNRNNFTRTNTDIDHLE